MNLLDEVQFESCLEEVKIVRAAGWMVSRVQGFRGVRFYAKKGDVTISGTRQFQEVLAFRCCLLRCIRHDEEAALLT